MKHRMWIILVLFGTVSAGNLYSGTTCYWVGSHGNENWDDPKNWISVPGPDDVVIIIHPLPGFTITLRGNVTIQSLRIDGDVTIDAGSYTLTFKNHPTSHLMLIGTLNWKGKNQLEVPEIRLRRRMAKIKTDNLDIIVNGPIYNADTSTTEEVTLHLDAGTGHISLNGEIGTTDPNKPHVYHMTLNAGGGVAQKAAMYLKKDLSIAAGTTLSTEGNIMNIGGSLTGDGSLDAQGSKISIGKDMTISHFTADTTATSLSTVTLSGTSSGNLAGYTFFNLVFNKLQQRARITSQGALTVTNSLKMIRGSWLAGSFSHTIAGDWDSSNTDFSFQAGDGQIQLYSPDKSIAIMLITKGFGTGGFSRLSLLNNTSIMTALKVSNNLMLKEQSASGHIGALTTNNFPMKIEGNLIVEAHCTLIAGTSRITMGKDTTFLGTFTANTSTLIFNGTTPQVLKTGGIGINPVYNLEIAGTTTNLTLGSSLEIDNQMIIKAGQFRPGNYAIQVDGDQFLNTTTDNAFDHTSGGGTNSWVTFTNPGTTEILGSNRFFNFRCEVEGAVLSFQEGKTQTISGEFHIDGQVTPAGPPRTNQISLMSTSAGSEWKINTTGTTTIIDAFVRDSRALTKIVTKQICIDGGNNTNWIFRTTSLSHSIAYSVAEDSNGNGKIDRIRVRLTNGVLLSDKSPYKPSLTSALVKNYTVLNMTSAGRMVQHEFIINLQEKKNPETGDTVLTWKLSNNSTLDGGLYNTVDNRPVEYGSAAPWNTADDRVAPIISATLAVAGGRNEIYIKFSEMVRRYNGTPVEAGDFKYNGTANIVSLTRLTTEGYGTSEALLLLDAPVSMEEVLQQTTIQVVHNLDDMSTVVFPDHPPVPQDPPLFALTTHRVSDLALGTVGDGVMEPVFANNTDRFKKGNKTSKKITDFTGESFLQGQDIYLESHIHKDIVATAIDTDLVYAVNVPDQYLTNNLWLPSHGVDHVFYLVDQRYPLSRTYHQTVPGPVNRQLRGYDILDRTSQLSNESTLDFFFSFKAGGRLPKLLYSARVLDDRSATWYKEIRPWTFGIHRNIVTQARGISIRNNIINPNNGEKTSVNYDLSQGGIVTIQVFDLAGSLVAVLQRGYQDPGDYAVLWDGRNRSGNVVARGIYFVRYTGPEGIDQNRKILVVK